MRRMLAVVAVTLAVAMSFGLFVQPTHAAPGKDKSTKVVGKAAGKSRGDGKVATTNSKNPKVTQPEAKGGPKARGVVGVIHIDNHTPWRIVVNNNSENVGTVSAYGDLSYYAANGLHHVHCVAYFDDGSEITWDADVNMDSGETHTISLYRPSK